MNHNMNEEASNKNWLVRIVKSKATYVVILLIISNIVFYLKYKDAEWSLKYSRAVPRIELSNTLKYSPGLLNGRIIGFVAFKNIEDQPKDLKQYLIIEANNQVFTAQDVYAFDSLAPRYTEPYALKVVENNNNNITLKDDTGNVFIIDKPLATVSWIDPQGDRSDLIIDDSQYRDFILSLY